MDLTNFLPNVEFNNYKVTLWIDGEKIKRFVRGTSKEHVQHKLKEELKREFPNSVTAIFEIEEIAKQTKVINYV